MHSCNSQIKFVMCLTKGIIFHVPNLSLLQEGVTCSRLSHSNCTCTTGLDSVSVTVLLEGLVLKVASGGQDWYGDSQELSGLPEPHSAAVVQLRSELPLDLHHPQ